MRKRFDCADSNGLYGVVNMHSMSRFIERAKEDGFLNPGLDKIEQLKMMAKHIVLFLLFCVAVSSCKENNKRKEIEQILVEWTGKEIQFPVDVQCSVLGRDTTASLCSDLLDAEYKILLYVDSTGCTGCKLRLFDWQQLIAETDSLDPRRLSYLFFFHPKDPKELQFLFKRDGWNYPVFIDQENVVQQLNHFPAHPAYQCFLLDKNNQVLMVGNPVNNRGIWKLYKEQVFGQQQESVTVTATEWKLTAFDFGEIRLKTSNQAVFFVKNTGNTPLQIQHMATSCGCTSVVWDQKPVKPQETTKIEVEMTPEETGYFNKTIEVYCNTKESPVKLKLSGMAIK